MLVCAVQDAKGVLVSQVDRDGAMLVLVLVTDGFTDFSLLITPFLGYLPNCSWVRIIVGAGLSVLTWHC